MTEQDDTKNWRRILILTDGLRWVIDSRETNSSMLEIQQICMEILKKFGKQQLGYYNGSQWEG